MRGLSNRHVVLLTDLLSSFFFLTVMPQKSVPGVKAPRAARDQRVSDLTSSLMVYDLLFGRGIQSGGPLKAAIHVHKAQLKAELALVKAREQAQSNEDLLPEHVRHPVVIPRFVRVNTLKLAVKDAIRRFKDLGFTFVQKPQEPIPTEGEFWQDQHLAELLLFAPNTDLHLNEMYLAGELVLQDKASCFPAVVLHPPQNATVIDACAAPGNKTSHLSALMHNTGRIVAFDISSRRLDLLKKLTGKVGATNIESNSPVSFFFSFLFSRFLLLTPLLCSVCFMFSCVRQFFGCGSSGQEVPRCRVHFAGPFMFRFWDCGAL